MPHSTNPFEDVALAMDAAHAAARELILTFPDRPVGRGVSPEAMAAAFDDALPSEGVSAAVAIDEWLARAEPGIVATAGPRFFGWVFGGVTPGAIAGDWLISALDQQGSLWTANPASVQTEHAAVRWLKEMFEIPDGLGRNHHQRRHHVEHGRSLGRTPMGRPTARLRSRARRAGGQSRSSRWSAAPRSTPVPSRRSVISVSASAPSARWPLPAEPSTSLPSSAN